MKINEEQFEAHQNTADLQREVFRKKLNEKQLECFDLADTLQRKCSEYNIPFLLFIAANQRESSIYRFHNFFHRRPKERFGKSAMNIAARWANIFMGVCFKFVKEICSARLVLMDKNGDIIADSDEQP